MSLIALAMAATTLSASAAVHPFYVAMYERGMARAAAGQNVDALRDLHTAAFGMVSDPRRYETAQIHIALISEKLGLHEEAKKAAAKIVRVEWTHPTYATLELPAQIRASFEKLAPKFIPVDQLALLRSPLEGATAVITGPVLSPAPASVPPVVQTEKKPQ